MNEEYSSTKLTCCIVILTDRILISFSIKQSEVPLPDTPHIQRNTVNEQMEKTLIYLV